MFLIAVQSRTYLDKACGRDAGCGGMEPFKEVFHRQAIQCLGRVLGRSDSAFDVKHFEALALKNLASLELKQRCDQIYRALCETLPQDFPRAAEVIHASLHPACDGNAQKLGVTEEGVQGWMIMPLAEYAGRECGGHWSLGLELLMEMTMRFTSEFGIRHLWRERPQEVMAVVATWTAHPNEHVRRLVSEGSRPRLPWGMQLPAFIADPQATLPLLEALRDDPSPYVRKSVANHLNDIARDHPQVALEVARHWHADAPQERQRLLRHAMRNLLKQGHPQVLALYELAAPRLKQITLSLGADELAMGGSLPFSLHLQSSAKAPQSLRLDYVLHHQKANGRLTPKVFRWKDLTLAPGEVLRLEKTHSFRPITTRVYYPGLHRLEIKINGAIVAAADFTLC